MNGLAVFKTPHPSAMHARIPRKGALTNVDTSGLIDDASMIILWVNHFLGLNTQPLRRIFCYV